MHLAEIDVGRFRYPLDDPRIAEFVESLDRVNARAWRYWRRAGRPGVLSPLRMR